MSVINDLRRIHQAAYEHVPLIVFTLLGQAAVGLFAIFSINSLFFSADILPFWISSLPAVLMTAALVASFFHLKYPRHAWRVPSNWRLSPLSKEALLAAMFTGFVYLWTLQTWGFLGWFPWRSHAILWIGLVTGLCLPVSMARLYQLRTIPIWNRMSTTLDFLASALLMGGAMTACLCTWYDFSKKMVWYVLGVGVLLRLGAGLMNKRSRENAGAIQLSAHHLPLWMQRAAEPWSILLALAILGSAPSDPVWQIVMAFLALVLIFLSEIAARVQFYVLHGHDRGLYPAVTPAVSSWQETLQ